MAHLPNTNVRLLDDDVLECIGLMWRAEGVALDLEKAGRGADDECFTAAVAIYTANANEVMDMLGLNPRPSVASQKHPFER